MITHNKVYFFFSQILYDFFKEYNFKNGDKFHLKFEKKLNVQLFYDSLKLISAANDLSYTYNDYTSYYLDFNGFKLIIASAKNDDFLTGLRNNFQKVEGFEDNSGILFIHNSELESINKGALDLSTKHMPFHYENIANEITKRFKETEKFSPTQCDFIDLILQSDNNDFHVENSNIFDLSRYLNILVNEELTAKDFADLNLFYDNSIIEENIPRKELLKRVQKNQKWHTDMSMHESVGSIENYIDRVFGQENIGKLKNKDNWSEISFGELLKMEEQKGQIKFNEYVHIKNEISDGLIAWDKSDGDTKTKEKIRNIIIFNPDQRKEVSLPIRFKNKLNKDFFNISSRPSDSDYIFYIDFSLALGSTVFFKDFHYREEKKGKVNITRFKVLIVPFGENFFREFKTKYTIQISKEYSFVEIFANEDLLINPGYEFAETDLVENEKYELFDDQTLKLNLTESNTLDKAKIRFQLKHGALPLFITAKLAEVKPLTLTSTAAWLKKNESEKSIYFNKRLKAGHSDITITLEHGNTNYFPSGESRRNNLLYEDLMIANEILIGSISINNTMICLSANIEKDVADAYLDVIKYFKSKSSDSLKLLPSLTYIEPELKSLYTKLLDCYRKALNEIEEDQSLTSAQQELLKLGSVFNENNSRFYLSPLHPLVISYQLNLREQIDRNFLNEPLDAIVKRLTPINLLPFINKGSGNKDYYISSEQEHSLEWVEYVDASKEGQSLSRRNVPEMLASKIAEFIKHFSYLFIDSTSPIKINLINTGDCREALKGIFNYFISEVNEKLSKGDNLNELTPIHISIYGSESFVTAFDQFSKFDDAEEIKDKLDIDIASKIKDKIELSDLLSLYHEKVHLSNIKGTDYTYAHISFYQFEEQEIEKSLNNTNSISTGINLNAVINDLPSVNATGNYRTSFGTKGLNYSNDLIELSQNLNALAYINDTSNIFKHSNAFASVINYDVKQRLQSIYLASQWVTFINPRVDLSFFKEDKDVVIIHYTDQFGNSTGYDSITVTSKWEQYEHIIKEYLKGKLSFIDNNIKNIINMFNAINGYWLLRLGSQSSNVEREKISMLSAFKEAFAILDHPNITWVSLSLEEILRVTAGAGLKQTDPNALFSVKWLQKSGSFSDDILMVGIEEIDDKIKVYFYPIEVKIGNNDSKTIEKAIIQVSNTVELLNNTLSKDDFNGKILRNYLINLVLNSAQKLALYDIWPAYSKKWIDLDSLRGRLLNDDFEISSLEEHIKQGAIISFKTSASFGKRKIQAADQYLLIQLFDTDGMNDLVKSIDDLKDRYTSENAVGITKDDLLEFKYISSSTDNKANYDYLGEPTPPIYQAAEIDKNKTVQYPDKDSSKNTVNHSPLKVTFGTHVNTAEHIDWYPTSTDKVMHTNTGIIGTMGTGKTQFTKSLITQLVRNQKNNVDGKPIGILIFDYKGDYIKDDFVEATNAKVYELENLPYNPLALSIGKKPKRRLPVHTASTLIETLSKAYNLGHVQSLELKEIVNEAYVEKGILKDDPSTWSNPSPTLEDVFELYLSNDKVKKDSLYAAVDKLNDFGIFEPNSSKTIPLYDLIDGVTIVNLNGYSNEIQTLVVAITLDLFYSQMQIHGHSKIDGNFRQITKIVLVDEADNFLSKNFESLRKILKEGREYGVGTILSTQFLNHFSTDDNEYSNYILTWIIHRVNEIKEKEIGSLFDLPNKKDRDELIGEIKSLDKHYSIVNLAGSAPIKINDLAFWKLR
ncbi:helicase HerA domain-containing protein [Sphingobacterium zeae]|uniref:helicase HerA domain-containing protein n=1 Tax=Sphingobacterium zeae TaxID=1776859 RepID=UPI00360D8243